VKDLPFLAKNESALMKSSGNLALFVYLACLKIFYEFQFSIVKFSMEWAFFAFWQRMSRLLSPKSVSPRSSAGAFNQICFLL